MGKGDDSSDEDEYVYYGTPITDEADARRPAASARGQRAGAGALDPGAVRALPVHQQVR